jgi:16S rRNA (uracil1498-N3)-methyltransferase
MEKDGFVSVHFETNILRCETAALYGIASIQTIFGGV